MDQAQKTSAEIGGSNGTMRYQTNDGTTTTIVDDSKEKLNQVINAIQKTLLLLHQLHLTVSSFTPDSQLHLLQRLNSLVMELDNMTKLSYKCNIQVPMEVLNLIDDGKNPDEFTKDVLNNSCTARNQVTKGKTDAFEGLRKHLLEELQQTFPVKSIHIEKSVLVMPLKQNGWPNRKVCYQMEMQRSRVSYKSSNFLL